MMEQTTDIDVHQEDSDRCSVDAKTTTTASSGAAQRNSLIELRRRDVTSNQLRGLVIPAASSAQGQGTRSSVCLPTISSTKPSSKVLLTLERRPSSGYQSVLARPGLPFTSTSRSTTSDVQRRSSLHGLPVLQQSSALSWSKSLVEPSDGSQRVNNVSVVSEEDVDSSKHTNELQDPESGRSTASIDAIGEASDEVAGLQSSTPSHSADEGLGDDRMQSPDDNTSSSCASSTSIQLDVSRDVSMSETAPMNDLQTDKQHETQHVNDVVEPTTRSCQPDNSCDLQNSTCVDLIESEPSSSESQSESVDHTVVSPIISLQIQPKSINNGPLRSHDDSVKNTGRVADAVDADGRNSESSLSLEGRLNGHAGDTLTDSNYSIPSRDTSDLTDVVINKGNLGLGFCISGGRAASTGDNPIVVKRVFKGETLLQNILYPGDEIISANDIDLGGMSQHEAWTVLKSLPDGSVRLSVRRRH